MARELDQRAWRWFVVGIDAATQHGLAHLHLIRADEPRWYERFATRSVPTLRSPRSPRLKPRAADKHHHGREAYANFKQAFVRRVLKRAS